MKKQPKLTPWFPAHVTPARAGLYETRFVGDFDAGFSMWFGDGWGSEYSNPSVADLHPLQTLPPRQAEMLQPMGLRDWL
jgi:hypothetical protein